MKKSTHQSSADKPEIAPPPNGQRVPGEAALLKEAVDNPGVAEIPEVVAQPGAGPLLEIPAMDLDPDRGDAGEPLQLDPALMTVAIDRPGPHSWVQLFPDRVLRTVLLAHKPDRNGSPVYHYVTPELQSAVKKDLKQVQIYLVYDTSGPGEAYLWIVPESEFSPYFNAVQQVLARGESIVKDHFVRFVNAEKRGRTCDVRVRPRGPDDPAPVLPSRPISQLLPEALGKDRIISAVSHPVYVSLTAGGRLR
jgi:hypothetical protein